MAQTFLSFDVGTRNLAYCLLSFDNPNVASCKIIEWEVLDLGGKSAGRNKTNCARRLTQVLNERFAFLRANDGPQNDGKPDMLDYVLIEAQPKGRSCIMVAVQMFLCQYFTMIAEDPGKRVKHVAFVSPRVKLNDAGLLPKPETSIEPVAAGNEPVAAGNEPVAAGNEPVAAGNEPVAAGNEPVAEPSNAGSKKRKKDAVSALEAAAAKAAAKAEARAAKAEARAAKAAAAKAAKVEAAAARRRANAAKPPRGSWKRYNGNKRQTVSTARYLLRDVILAHDKLVEFDAAPKRDDLADAFMQCVCFFVDLHSNL
jgi:hypothetical protein